jgi:hypothetical protein
MRICGMAMCVYNVQTQNTTERKQEPKTHAIDANNQTALKTCHFLLFTIYHLLYLVLSLISSLWIQDDGVALHFTLRRPHI